MYGHYLDEFEDADPIGRAQAKIWARRMAERKRLDNLRRLGFSPDPKDTHRYFLYPAPNGGKRILPSVYTKLTDEWLQANGGYVRPERMSNGHLENVLKLLKESHGNLVARATELLGKVNSHFGNSMYGLDDEMANLCVRLQQIEVDRLYPIWHAISRELQSRGHREFAEADDSWILGPDSPF